MGPKPPPGERYARLDLLPVGTFFRFQAIPGRYDAVNLSVAQQDALGTPCVVVKQATGLTQVKPVFGAKARRQGSLTWYIGSMAVEVLLYP